MLTQFVDGKICKKREVYLIIKIYKSRIRETAGAAYLIFIYFAEKRCNMIGVFAEQKVVTVCMFTCLALSIFLKIFLGMLYRHMIKEADNMAITNNKLLKQCKIKFSNCYELNNGIHNIPVFVDKFINRLSLGCFSFDLIYHLSGQMMLFSVVAAGIGICRSIIAGRTLGAILPFYIVSFLGLYLYFSVSTVADIKGKRRMLKINLVDYLENHLASRMNVTRRDMEMLYGDAAFQEKAGTSEGADRGKRSKTGRRAVELMPVGGRLTAAKENAASQEAAEEARRMMEGAREASLRITPGESPRQNMQTMAQQTAFSQVKGTPETVQNAAQNVEAGASKEASEEVQRMVQVSQDAAVTEEELEMLLKEFLTG